MSSKQQIAVGVDVTASGTHITLVAPTDTGHMEVIYSEFHPMPPAQGQRAQGAEVPDFSAMAKVLSDRVASACCVDPDDNWKIYGQEYIEDVRAMTLGVKRTVISIKQVFVFLLRLAKREVAARNLQGPLGIIHVTGYVTRYGAGTLLYFLALISVNLGVLNLLPIPIFDGGHLMLLACEKIKGSPVNERLVNTVTTVMFFLLIALAIYVTFHDVIRLVG